MWILVFTVPMRNWNTIIRKTKFTLTTFLQYLWGIETTVWMFFWYKNILCFYSTYEELKLVGPVFIGPVFMGFTVPMRNWNLIFYSGTLYTLMFYSTHENWTQFILSFLKRCCFYSTHENWNYICSRYFLKNNKFYSTHEVKLNLQYIIFSLYIGFYSTYEELKPWPLFSNYFFVPSFYSTYEELKQLFGIRFQSIFYKFLQYLWGIETPHISRRCNN